MPCTSSLFITQITQQSASLLHPTPPPRQFHDAMLRLCAVYVCCTCAPPARDMGATDKTPTLAPGHSLPPFPPSVYLSHMQETVWASSSGNINVNTDSFLELSRDDDLDIYSDLFSSLITIYNCLIINE